ncbi:MAG: hypothetical protein ACP5KH_04055 [Thermodesulfovibrio sp.]
MLIFSDRLPSFNFFIIYASIVIFQIFLCKVPENAFLSFIKNIGLPVFSVLIAFDTIGELIAYINPKDIDAVLLKFDLRILSLCVF